MNAYLLTGFGGFDMLEYRTDVTLPDLGAHEVLIKVKACGVNNTDIWTRKGAYGNALDGQQDSGWRGGAFTFPRIQGADIVGEVVQLGENAPQALIGKRVMVNPTLYKGEGMKGLYNADIIGSERDGGFAEYASVPAQNAIPVSSDYSDAELATFMVSYLTAEHMTNRAEVQAGQTVLITGASGGVGSALLQLNKRRNTRVIAVVGRGKEDKAYELGADIVINRGADLAKQLKQHDIAEVDVALDVVGSEQANELIDLLAFGGHFVTAGAIAGTHTEIDWRKIYLKHLNLRGSTMGTIQEAKDLVSYIEKKEIKPLLAKAFALENLIEAQQFFLNKNFFGKLVIVP